MINMAENEKKSFSFSRTTSPNLCEWRSIGALFCGSSDTMSEKLKQLWLLLPGHNSKAHRSVSLLLPSKDGGVCKHRPKGFGANRRSRWSPWFLSSVIQVSLNEMFLKPVIIL